ncbi:MAG: glycosyltransferase [Opitutaceae bacterium]|nr:glycosyltransferase [Opitutaceae bacterium]
MDLSHSTRRLLIVSPGFAPANTPDSHRARLSLPHWKRLGWDVEVLAVRGEDIQAPLEPALLDSIPAEIPVHRVQAWPLRLTRWLGTGSLSWRARGPLGRAGDRLLARRRFDLVFFSTSQFGIFPLGPRWRARHGVPYVLDFQDPWVTDYYERPGAPRPPGGWKYRSARWLAQRAEPRCLRQAAGLVSVSPRYFDDFATRYAWFERERGLVLPFPAADTDLARLEAGGCARLWPPTVEPKHLVAVGAVGPYMRASIEGLCRGLGRLRRDSENAARRLRLHFVGTAYASGGPASVLPAAQAAGVADLVDERPARVPYLEALRWLLAGDATAVIGSDDPGYVPSRLANVFWVGRPMLAIAPPASSLAARLAGWGGPAAFAPTDETGIRDWLRGLAEGRAAPGPAVTPAWREIHSSGGMTRRLAEYFQGCCLRPAASQ